MATAQETSEPRQLTEQGRQRKQQIVEAAMALFAERGYSATRISDICESAGVAKGLFYWYFPTKLDLFSELVRTMRQQLRRAQARAADADADPLTRIRQGAEASVRFMAEHSNYFELLDVERSDPAIASVLRSGSSVYRDDVTALVIEAQSAGLIVDANPHLMAVGVLGAVAAFDSARRSSKIDVSTDELAATVGEWVAKALRAP
ncbi:MAG TPA: TetR family transcriptional regulator [Ilumatobacter sp.]|nr:TetR family transcriptional regulator [Ilumatobacter sp.]